MALGAGGERIGARVGEFSASIHFLTRLPLPRHEGSGSGAGAAANLAQAVWAFPLAGCVGALIIALLIRIAAIAGLTEPALVAVALIAAHVGARAVLPFVMFLLPAA